MVELRLHDDDAEQRLDRYLRKLLREAPLGLLHRMIRSGDVRIGGERVAASYRLCPGDVLELRLSAARFDALRGSAPSDPPRPAEAGRRSAGSHSLDALTVHRDSSLLVVDKPGGLAIHGGTGQQDDLTSLVRRSVPDSGSDTFRCAPAHRIDRGTSGLVAFGLTARALRGLTAAFREGRIEKTYFALTGSPPEPREGMIDLPLDIRSDGDPGTPRSRAKTHGPGKSARTRYRTRSVGPRSSLVEVRIDTGRTHQIRAHLAALHCPILGDSRYGGRRVRSLADGRIALHAARLALRHPLSGAHMDLVSELPAELAALIPTPYGDASD